MLRTIIKIILSLLALSLLAIGGVYLYLRLNPRQVIRLPDNPITQKIIEKSLPNYSSCQQPADCSWYEENIGKPPNSGEPDRIMTYCANSTIKQNCPSCQKRSLEEIKLIENTESDSDINPCSCLTNKCTIIYPLEPSSSPSPST